MVFTNSAGADQYYGNEQNYGHNFQKPKRGFGSNKNSRGGSSSEDSGSKQNGQAVTDDSELVQAVSSRSRVDFVEAANMEVVKVLADDTNGLQHQKWMVKLSSGDIVMSVYNIDMCERVPLKVGDKVSMGGQFVWTPQGGLIHWLHHDPEHTRPDGYVELAGKVYCGN